MINILFQCWKNIPHSYAIVACFLIVNLQKYYKDKVKIYIKEMPYYNPEWKKNKLIYTDEYNEILNDIEEKETYDDIDIIFNLTYEYDITPTKIPKCVFYTSEYSWIDYNYFSIYQDNIKKKFPNNEILYEYLNGNNNIYFTNPSVWSSNGMKLINKFMNVNKKDKIISHGADCDIFKPNGEQITRLKIRKFYKIEPDDIVLINIGAMTDNKGLVYIIKCLHILYNVNKRNYKLILKGNSELYKCKDFINNTMERIGIDLNENNNIEFVNNTIIFVDKTLTYKVLNDLYNSCDLYVSPYICEGFNLTPLEALASGMDVMITSTGSTKEYIDNISKEYSDFIIKIDSKVEMVGEKYQNNIDINDMLNKLHKYSENRVVKDYDRRYKLNRYIDDNLSWKNACNDLYEYFKEIIQENNECSEILRN